MVEKDTKLEDVAASDLVQQSKDGQSASPGRFYIDGNDQRQSEESSRSIKSIHPLTRPLTIQDVESCVELENAAFAEHERCSREKFMYRLSKCGELSLGIFCTALPDSTIPAETLKSGRLVETTREKGEVGVLLAHIVSTRSNDNVVTDEAMDFPRDWSSVHHVREHTVGHQDDGRTICIHSLGVLPKYQGGGLGRTIMTAYLQQMISAGIADRIALIAHDYLVEYYENFGFRRLGPSKAQFGGGGWIDMVFEFESSKSKGLHV